MQPKLKETLLKLKPEVDQMWTEDGLPRLDVLSKALGFDVTRDFMDKEAPGFTRNTAAAFGEDAVAAAEEGQAPAQEPAQGVPPVPTAPDHEVPDAPELETRQSRLQALRERVSQAKADETDARERAETAARELAAAEAAVDVGGETVMQKYQRRQHEIRMERATAVQAIHATGINVDLIQRVLSPAPVDAARMGMKRQFPQQNRS